MRLWYISVIIVPKHIRFIAASFSTAYTLNIMCPLFSPLIKSYDSSSSSSDSEDEKKEKAEEDKISTKTNNILNERLYDQMIHRNKEIEDIVDNLQKISPILPSDVVYENDKSLNQLKQALSLGKSYVIDKFINAEYGENMLFFTKLDSLYVLLMDKINSNLKGINNSSNDD